MVRLPGLLVVTTAFTAACVDSGPTHRGAPRTVVTTLRRAEGVGVGTVVRMAGLPIGRVTAIDSTADGVRLTFEVTRPDAPLREGARVEVHPTGPLSNDALDVVAGPVTARPLTAGAEIPGRPRLATSAERRAAMRIVLPALGLPALGALVPPPPDTSARLPSPTAP
ncbi:MAG: MlaD family protein [Gemmatimonadaceae bacterium]